MGVFVCLFIFQRKLAYKGKKGPGNNTGNNCGRGQVKSKENIFCPLLSSKLIKHGI